MQAAGEVTNAAKHAGTGRVDVYAEMSDGAVDVFVRDRGRGFDQAAVLLDQYGVPPASSTACSSTGYGRGQSAPVVGHGGPAAPASQSRKP